MSQEEMYSEEQKYSINWNYERAVRNLNSEAWDKMQDKEIIQDLQAIENKNAMDQNRLSCEVSGENLVSGMWGYQEGLKIVVNSNELNGQNIAEHLDTIFHEGQHAMDWQAQFISEVKEQYTPDQILERNSEIPDPDKDFNGYWNHPAEVAARQAGEYGVNQTAENRENILFIDETMRNSELTNQILQTHDYIAMDNLEQLSIITEDNDITNQTLQISESRDLSGMDEALSLENDVDAENQEIDLGSDEMGAIDEEIDMDGGIEF